MKDKLNKIKRTIVGYKPPKFVIRFILLLPIILIFINCFNLDNDTWFLLNHGRYVLSHGIPHIEPFTIHSNLSFVMQQWLSSVIFWVSFHYIGKWALCLIPAVMLLFITIFMHKLCMLISDNKYYLSSIVTFVIESTLSLLFMVTRPQVFTYLILVIELYLLESYVRKRNNKYLIPLPILSILLINLHASVWFMLFLFMLPYLINSFKFDFVFIKSDGYPKKNLFIVLIIMLLCGLVNPYGLDAIKYLFNSYGVFEINNYIGEMISPSFAFALGKINIAFIFLFCFIYAKYKKGKLEVRYLLLVCGTIYLGLSHYKSYAYFLIGGIFPIAYYVKDEFSVYKDNFSKYSKHVINVFKLVCYVLFIASVFIFSSITLEKSKRTDKYISKGLEKSVNYITKHYDKEKIKVYADYNDGGYVEYMGIKSYIDPRAEVFLKKNNKQKDIFVEYYNVQKYKLSCDVFLNTYDFDLLILDEQDALNKCMNNKKYNLVYSDKDRKLYEVKK